MSGPRGILVELRAVRGSAPREAGARMLVTATGIEGTIGGGMLEYAAIARARALLASGTMPDEVLERHALGPGLGQCCGGAVILGFSGTAATLAPDPPLFRLQLHGAGHVGRAIVAVLRTLNCAIDWIDSRADAFPSMPDEGAARIARHRHADPTAAIAEAPPGTAFLVMTHSHALDAAICAAILRRGDAAYAGLIGSATKRARFTAAWRRQGLTTAAIDRLVCPIGIPGIGGKQPEIIALAVAAQLAERFAASATAPRVAFAEDCDACSRHAGCGRS